MNELVVKMVFGSHLYGLNNEDSDMDYKGVVLPTANDILMQKADFHISKSSGKNDSKNGVGDVDEEYFSLHRFLLLAAKGETVALDMLFAKDTLISTSDIWDDIVKNRSLFFSKNMKAYVGYVRKQAAKYGVKGSRLQVLEVAINICKSYADSQKDVRGIPKIKDIFHKLPIGEHSQILITESESSGEQKFYEICGRKFQDSNRIDYVIENLQKIYDAYGARAQKAKDNENIDWKAISHALRAGYQAKHIYLDGTFEYPLPETQFLKDVKEGKLDYLTEVQPILEELVDEVMVLAEDSNYPEKVDMKKVEAFVLRVHKKIVLDYPFYI